MLWNKLGGGGGGVNLNRFHKKTNMVNLVENGEEAAFSTAVEVTGIRRTLDQFMKTHIASNQNFQAGIEMIVNLIGILKVSFHHCYLRTRAQTSWVRTYQPFLISIPVDFLTSRYHQFQEINGATKIGIFLNLVLRT